jgi:hypothetical protein
MSTKWKKMPLNKVNGHKVYQMVTKDIFKIPPKCLKNDQNWEILETG